MTDTSPAPVDAADAPVARSGTPAPRLSTGPTLRSYARLVRRQRVLICLFALLGTAVGALVVAQMPPTFVAETRVAVTPQPTGADIDPDRPRLVSLDSDAQILASGEVLLAAAEAASFPGGATALRDSLDVSAEPNSRVLIVRVTDADRALAIRACGAIVDAFLATRSADETERGAATAAALDTQISDVLQRLSALRTSDDLTDAAAANPAAALLIRLQELEDNLRVVTTAGSATPGTIVSGPAAPAVGSRNMAAADVVSGLLIGTLVGVGVASQRGSERGRGRATATSQRPRPSTAPPGGTAVSTSTTTDHLADERSQ